MTQITISAQVVNGHLQHEKILAELEGQHVLATLTVAPTENANGKHATDQPPLAPDPNVKFDPEPPPWLDVEHDVYFPMTVPVRLLGRVNIRVEEGRPCIILPEELPDE